MKLHLPKGLRTALLAVVALTSAPVASAAAPATYGYLVQKTSRYYEVAAGIDKTVLNTPSMSESWVMSVAGYFYPVTVEDGTLSGGSVIFGNVDVPFTMKNLPVSTKKIVDGVEKNGPSGGTQVTVPKGMKKNQCAIVFSEAYWNILAITGSGDVMNLTEKPAHERNPWNAACNNPESKIEIDYVARPAVQVTLNWIAGEDGKGSLYLTGVSLAEITNTYDSTISDDGKTAVSTEALYTGRVQLLKNVSLTDEKLEELGGFWSVAKTDLFGTSEIVTTISSAGSGDDPKAWLITGTADVKTLLDGGYLTEDVVALTEGETEGETGGETEGEGSEGEVAPPGESAPVVTPETAPVQFTGSHGVLFANLPADYQPEGGMYEITYDRETTVDNNILYGDAGMSVGFGAAEGAKLIVGSTALSEAVLATDMRIVGEGTVKLEMGDATSLNLAELGTGSDLEIKNNGSVDIDLTGTTLGAGATITRTEDSVAGDGNDLTIKANAGAKEPNTISLAALRNLAGGVRIDGSQDTGDSYSIVNVDEIKASGAVNLTGMVTSNTVTAGGDLNVGTLSNPYGLLTATSAKSGGKLAVHGAAEIGTIEAGSVEANMIEDEETSLKAGSIKTSALTYNLTTYEIAAPEPPAEEGGEVAPLTGEAGEEEVLGSTISSISISTAEAGTLLSGNVSLNAAGISAGAIADDATIDMDSACGAQVKLGSAAGLNLTVDGAASIMQGVTAGNLELAVGSIKASTISAGTINLQDDYKLSGARVTAPVTRTSGTAINVEGTGVQLSNLNIGEGVVLTTPGSAEMTNVTIAAGNTFGGADGDAVTINKQPQQNNPATLDSLTLTGTIDGDTLTLTELVISGEDLNFDAKTSYTLLTVNSGTLEDLTTKDSITLDIQSYVDAEVTMENGSIVITGVKSEGKFKDELTDTANRTATMAALDGIEEVEGGSPLAQLQKDLGQLFRYELADRQELLSAISGASTTVLADSQRRGVQDVQKNLRNRIIQMGGGANEGLTTDWDYVGLQAWAQADGGVISTDGSGDESGYDFNTWGATVGANLDLTANTVVGMSFSASYGELDVDSADNASGNNDAYYVSFFARHQKERWVQMLILTVGTNDMDLERTVGIGSNRYTGSGSTDGTTLSAYYEIGYTVGLNYEFTHILQPMVSLSLTSAKVDGYAEEGSIGNAGLTYDGDSYIYGTLGIGARYQGVLYETVHERNAVVEARALITQDFGDTTDEAMVGIGTSDLYKVKGADSTGTGFELGAGISLPVEQHTTIYADADVTFRPDSTGFRGNIGLRYDF